MILRIFIISALVIFSACSKPERDENVFLEQTKTMDKARGVENTLMDAQKQRREAEEEQSGQ